MDISAVLQRVVRAVTFDTKFYNEAESDASLNQEALIVVIIASLLGALGGIWGGVGAVIGTFIVSIVGYFALAYITFLVGTNFFKGQADIGQMLRALGYAWAPYALGVLGILPCIGWLGVLVGSLWALATTIVAIREAQDIEIGPAVLTALAGWLVWGILYWLLRWIIF
jgi:hypothetical protein